MHQERNYTPIYRRLTDYYLQRIRNHEYPPGARLDSINRIMNRHNVSRETAKLVISQLIEAGYAESIQGKGTYVKEVRETIQSWGVVIPFYSSNIEQLIALLSAQAALRNCDLKYFLHYNNPSEEMRITSDLINQGYRAIIIIPNYDETNTAAYYRKLVTGNSRLVLADNTMAGSYFDYVIQSYDLGVKRAFAHLTKRHNGNILLVGNENWKGQHLVFDLVESTLRMLLQEHGKGKELIVVQGLHEVNAGFISSGNVTGILTMQDTESVRIIGRLLSWGFRIPGDITLVSYGNTEITRLFHPSITVIDCNYEKMALEIGASIDASKRKDKEQIVISPELIVRET